MTIRRSGMATTRGHDQVRERPGERHERLAAAAVAQVVGVDRRGLGPADEDPADSALSASSVPPSGIEMDDRVERQASLPARRGVAQLEGRAGVAELVDRERDQDDDRDRDQAWTSCCAHSRPEKLGLLLLVVLGADGAAVAQVGQARQRLGDLERLVSAHGSALAAAAAWRRGAAPRAARWPAAGARRGGRGDVGSGPARRRGRRLQCGATGAVIGLPLARSGGLGGASAGRT